MKAVLISINPPHTGRIFERLKTIEWRKSPLPSGKCFCYETKKCFGLGKVIGEFEIWKVERFEHISLIPEEYISLGCVPEEFLEAYSEDKPLYAHFIKDSKIYTYPKELREFYRKCEKFACEGCEHLKYQHVNADELDYDCEFAGYEIPITRPPQSWCYVEGGGEK